jgi:hypothetical protein
MVGTGVVEQVGYSRSKPQPAYFFGYAADAPTLGLDCAPISRREQVTPKNRNETGSQPLKIDGGGG